MSRIFSFFPLFYLGIVYYFFKHWSTVNLQSCFNLWYTARARAHTHTHTHTHILISFPLNSVQSLSRVQLFKTPWTIACQASLSITNSQSPPKPMSIESMMPSNHLILCRPLLLLPSVFPSIRVFSNESALRIRWPKYWSFSFSINPSNEHPGLISFRMNWYRKLSKCFCPLFKI